MDGSAVRPATCSFSLIVEWENAGRIGSARAEAMIAELGRQLAALPPDLGREAEILFIHDGSCGSESAVEAAVRTAPRLPAPWRSIAAPDSSYAGQKWHGAQLARGGILVFLDSDVVPEAGWLEGLVGPFERPEVDIVCGATFVDPVDFYSATMALGWLFPLRRPGTGLVETDWIQANNFAVRRDIFLALPPPVPEGYREGTVRFFEMLRARGHVVRLNRAAAVAHPPPEHFALRALWSGYDNALRYRRRRALWRGAGVMLADVPRAWVRVAQGRRQVGLGPARAAAAAALLSLYYLLRLGGYAAGLAAPGFIARRLRAADHPRSAA